MSGDVQVRICERLGVRFPRATRLVATFQFREESLVTCEGTCSTTASVETLTACAATCSRYADCCSSGSIVAVNTAASTGHDLTHGVALGCLLRESFTLYEDRDHANDPTGNRMVENSESGSARAVRAAFQVSRGPLLTWPAKPLQTASCHLPLRPLQPLRPRLEAAKRLRHWSPTHPRRTRLPCGSSPAALSTMVSPPSSVGCCTTPS